MTWGGTADVVDFDAAIAWFRSRVPITDEELGQLEDEVRKRAFTVAGVAQMDVVAQVYDSIEAALAAGLDLDDFKANVSTALTDAWGEDDGWRVETIFRTNVQSSYAAGRYKQATDPSTAEDRPYWMFDAILDGRTTEVCEKSDGTVRPADDPWWHSHLPPLHFNCRSHFVTLTEDQAKERGVTKAPTHVGPDEGFGAPPTMAEAWEPKKADYPAPLFKEFAAKPPPPPVGMQVGVHIGDLKTTKGAPDVLDAVKGPQVLAALAKTPLKEVIFKKSLTYRGDRPNGMYSPSNRRIQIAVDRKSDTFGDEFKPGKSWSVSYSGTDKKNAATRTFVHELGHHLHMQVSGHDGDRIVRKAFEKGKPITRYAGVNRFEYFAETFAAYRFHPAELRAHDPVGYEMVEALLDLVGGKP